jgi:hypothetical protein
MSAPGEILLSLAVPGRRGTDADEADGRDAVPGKASA